ncbi:hypothetical protein BJX65DRAFT_297024 [Aspergillus insuetus]
MDHYTPASKRKRVSFACNYCRSRKTRCDERQPSCTPCLAAGVECITTDKRRPGVPVHSRRRAVAAATSGRRRDTSTPTPSPKAAIEWMMPASMTSDDSISVNQSDGMLLQWKNKASVLRGACSSYCPHHPGQQPPGIIERCPGRLPMMPRFCGITTVHIMTKWLDLALCRLGMHEASLSAKISFPPALASPRLHDFQPPNLPPSTEASGYLSQYMSAVDPVFPVPIRSALETIQSTIFTAVQAPNAMLATHEPPLQALYYLSLALGSMVGSTLIARREQVSSYIGYCNSLLGHLIGYRSLRSVQAVFLLSLVLLQCGRIFESFEVLKIAVSIGQSISLDRSQKPDRCSPESHPEGRQTWSCVLVLEKFLAFETCQPSAVALSPETDHMDWEAECLDDTLYFSALSGLVKTLHEINEQSLRTWRTEQSQNLTAEDSVKQKLNAAGRLVLILHEYYDNLSSLGLLLTTSTSANAPRRAFLTCQYYYILILLHRTTLLVETSDLLKAVDQYGSGQPWQDLVRSAPMACVEAARNMIGLLVHLDDAGATPVTVTTNAALAAAYTLSVRILKDSRTKLNRADFELMKVGIDLARDRCRTYYGNGTLDQIFPCIESFIQSRFDMEEAHEDRHRMVEETQTSLSISWPDPADELISLPASSYNEQAIDWAGWDWRNLCDNLVHEAGQFESG